MRPSPLGRSTRPRRWASSWREPNVPDTWIATDASGRSIEKLATLLTTSSWISPARNAWNSFWRSATVVSPVMTRRVEALGQRVELVEVLADDQGRLAAVPLDELRHDPVLGVGASTRAGSARPAPTIA